MSDAARRAAVFLGLARTAARMGAVVWYAGESRMVDVAAGVDRSRLALGDDVWLNDGGDTLVRGASLPHARATQVATVEAVLADGRLMVKLLHVALVLRPVPRLDPFTLRNGDLVSVDAHVGLVYEHLSSARRARFLFEHTPRERLCEIGGLDNQIEQVTRALSLHFDHPELANAYGVRRLGSVLLVGPPGTGKTMIARALANWLGQRSPSGRAKFMPIKPAELHSMWYGESERAYREVFREAREASEADPSTPVMMFFDELDAIGRARGGPSSEIDDRVMTSFLAELDGVSSRGNIFVVAATNRRDILDPALSRPGRLGDLVIEIPRPGPDAAAAILAKHLPESAPYDTSDDAEPSLARLQIIARAVSWIYSTSAHAGALASIVLSDGTRRLIQARELVGGAHLANIARRALERACRRAIEGVAPGLTWADVVASSVEELDGLVAGLSPAACRTTLPDLPRDVEVVQVEREPASGRSWAIH